MKGIAVATIQDMYEKMENAVALASGKQGGEMAVALVHVMKVIVGWHEQGLDYLEMKVAADEIMKAIEEGLKLRRKTMDIPRHLDELYDKAVQEGMVPWNDAAPTLDCPVCGGKHFERAGIENCAADHEVEPPGGFNAPEYQPDEEPDWEDWPAESDDE